MLGGLGYDDVLRRVDKVCKHMICAWWRDAGEDSSFKLRGHLRGRDLHRNYGKDSDTARLS